MRQVAQDLSTGWKLVWGAWKRLARILAHRFWPWVVGFIATFGLLVAGVTYNRQIMSGTVPLPAMDITGTIWWEYGRSDGQLELVFRGKRIRYMDCAGSPLIRTFKYEDGREVIVKPDQASSASALDLIPKVTSTADTDDVLEFSHRYFLSKFEAKGLTMISWVLDAPDGFCKPDGRRRRELVGQVHVPAPDAAYLAPAAR